MARANARRRNDFQRGDPFKKGFKKLGKFAATIGEADSIIVQEGSKALVKGLKQVLRQQRGPSAPGQPPGRQSGRLAASVGREVVAGQMRVGTGHFTAPWLEFGLIVPPKPAQAGGLRVGASGKRRHHKARQASPGHVLEPRPFMQAGLDAAIADVKGLGVSALRKKTKELAV